MATGVQGAGPAPQGLPPCPFWSLSLTGMQSSPWLGDPRTGREGGESWVSEPCREGRPLWQGMAGQEGCVGSWELFPFLPGLQTRAQADFLPLRGVSPGHPSLSSGSSSPAIHPSLPLFIQVHPPWLHSLSPALVLWSPPRAPLLFLPASLSSVHLRLGFSCLYLECLRLGVHRPQASGRASSWANPCTFTGGEIRPQPGKACPQGHLRTLTADMDRAPQMAVVQPGGAAGGPREGRSGAQEVNLGGASTSASPIQE